jgi:hypothetical protein
MSDGELLDPVAASSDANIPISGVGNPVGMSSGHLADSPHRSYYIWKEPPRQQQQQQQQQQGPPQGMFLLFYYTPKINSLLIHLL